VLSDNGRPSVPAVPALPAAHALDPLLDAGPVNHAPRGPVNLANIVVGVRISIPAWSIKAEQRFAKPGAASAGEHPRDGPRPSRVLLGPHNMSGGRRYKIFFWPRTRSNGRNSGLKAVSRLKMGPRVHGCLRKTLSLFNIDNCP